MFAYAFGDLRVVIGVRMSGEEFHLITLQQTEQVVSARKRYDRVQTGRGHRGMHGDHDLLGLVVWVVQDAIFAGGKRAIVIGVIIVFWKDQYDN